MHSQASVPVPCPHKEKRLGVFSVSFYSKSLLTSAAAKKAADFKGTPQSRLLTGTLEDVAEVKQGQCNGNWTLCPKPSSYAINDHR